MIQISNDPISGLTRKVEYDFYWFRSTKQIIIDCMVYYYKDGEKINDIRLKPYNRKLVASDSLVNPQTGEVLTDEQIIEWNNIKNIYNQYQNKLSDYNTNYNQYLILLNEYNNFLENMPENQQELLDQYEIDYENYLILLEQYNIDYQEFLNNPELSEPEAPISPEPIYNPLEPIEPENPTLSPEPINLPALIEEYDFYAYVLGITPIIIPDMLSNIILLRDFQGKFNI